jgi:multicomponent Na+:H+ antiporter subunit G
LTVADASTLLCALLLVAGSAFALIAALGLVRLPDLLTRMHAASKAGTAGSGLLLIAAAMHLGDWAAWAKALAAIAFFVLTAPVSAHLLAKASRESAERNRADDA